MPHLAHRVARLVLAPRPDHQHGGRTFTGTDEDVVDARRAVEEVPLPELASSTVNDRDALAVQDEEVLLHRLEVVPAVRNAGSMIWTLMPVSAQGALSSSKSRIIARFEWLSAGVSSARFFLMNG